MVSQIAANGAAVSALTCGELKPSAKDRTRPPEAS